MEPERLLPVYWDGQEDKPYPTRIRIVSRNERGVLAKVASLLSEEGVNINGASIHSSLDGRAEMDLTIEVRNAADLYLLLERLRALPSVLEVARASAS
jgi:GTP pyrophosphokinase